MSIHSHAEMEQRYGAAMLLAVRAEQGRKIRPEAIRRNERRNAILDFLRAEGPQFTQDIINHLAKNGIGGSRSTVFNHAYELQDEGLVKRTGGDKIGAPILWEAAQ